MVKIKGVKEFLIASKSEKNTYQSYRGNLRKFLHFLYPDEVPAYDNSMSKEDRVRLDEIVDSKSIEYLKVPDLEDRVERDLTYFRESVKGEENTKSYAIQIASMWLRECRVDLGESFTKKLSKKKEPSTDEHIPSP